MGLSASPGSSPSPAVHDMIRITVQPESQVVAEGAQVSLTCWATGPPGLAYQWFCGKQEVGPTSPCHAGAPGPLPGRTPTLSPCPSPPPPPVGARSHGSGAGDRHGRPARPTPVVHLPRELRGCLRLLQVGPRPGGEEQQPQLRWAPSSLCWHPRGVTRLRDQGGSYRASLRARGAPVRPAACPLPSQRLLPHHGGAADPAAAAAVLPG